MVQWLHISDLHFQPNTDPDQESLIRALLADCRSRKIRRTSWRQPGISTTFWDTGNYLASWRFTAYPDGSPGAGYHPGFISRPRQS